MSSSRPKRKVDRKRRSRPRVPPAPGKSQLELLPIELLTEIHFLLPSKLPILSKTLLSIFSPPTLSLHQTFQHFMSTKRFQRLRDNDERAEWFFTLPAFLHTPESLLYFLHECYFKPDAPFAYTLPFQPPFDPWLVVFNSKMLPAPNFLHWIYHHLPTSAFRACQAVWILVEAGEWRHAKVLLECGADPLAVSKHAIDGWPIKLDVAPHLRRRCENWPTASVVTRTRCSCGHECSAQQAGPAQAELMDLLTTSRRRLAKGATGRFKPAPNSRVLKLMDKAPSSWKINLHCFMLPQNGTVGRIPTPYSNVGRTLGTYSTSRHRSNLAAAFVDEYLEQLFQTFARLCRASRLPFHFTPNPVA